MKATHHSLKAVHLPLLFLFLLIASTVSAQKEDEKYAAFARELRNEVWAMELPGFDNIAIPEKYKSAPAVILAAHDRLEVTRKTKLDWWGTGLTKQQITCRGIFRQLVYINSQSALEEMSEYSFLSQEKKRYTRNEQQRVLGIRIFKPDGTIKEVDPEEFLETDESRQARSRGNILEKWQKVAVPGLEIGDIIDVFFAKYATLNDQNLEPFSFYFKEQYPLLTYSIHCEIDPKLSTFYRCLNGAPDFDQSTDSEGNHILDLRTITPRHPIPDLWYNAARQMPMIQMFIYNSKTPYAWMPPSVRRQGLHANPNPQLIIEDTRAAMRAPGTNWSGLRSGRKSEIAKALKARQAEGWSDEKLMDYLYQYCYYRYMESGADYTPASFILLMHDLLEKAGISHQVGITTKDTQVPLAQLISYHYTVWFIRLEANGKCYTPPACYAAPGEIPANLQGEDAILEGNARFTLPIAKPEENRDVATITASIEETMLHIKRREEMTGALKEPFQPYLVLDEDLYNSLRRMLGITTTIFDETKEKFHADLRESYRREREQEKERYRSEIIGYHDSDEGIGTNIGYRLLSIGNRTDSTAFAYEVDYSIDGYVKKAGPNLILSIGRLIGSQLEFKGEQRLRQEDIYWEMPRSYGWNITVRLPEGCQVSPEGLEKLNIQVENECGAFIAQATAESGTLTVKAEKHFNHKVEPVANWEKLLEIIDAAKAYEGLSVVLKK